MPRHAHRSMPGSPLRDTKQQLLAAALDAARRGWFVFPLRPGSKIPALRHWQHRATTDRAQIRAWWRNESLFNVGIACGPSGLLVLDLDAAHGPAPTRWAALGATHGRDVLALLADRAHQPDPRDTFTVATPTGGEHRYFQRPAGTRLGSTVGERGHGLGWHVDTRGPGSLVAGPGSRTILDGRPAEWAIVRDGPVAMLPNWLINALTPPATPPADAAAAAAPVLPANSPRVAAYVQAALDRECRNVAAADEGQRHLTVFAAAAALGELAANHWVSPETIARRLTDAARRHISVADFTPAELDRTIRDGIDTGRHTPRTLTDRPRSPHRQKPHRDADKNRPRRQP